MDDNTEYWKEIFGEDYNEDLADMLQIPKPDKPADKPDDKPPMSGQPPMSGLPKSDNAPDNNKPANIAENRNPANNRTGTNKPASSDFKSQGNKISQSDKMSQGDNLSPWKSDGDKLDDFNVNFDFDKEYKDVPDNRPARPGREKRTGCLGGVMYAVFIICICLLLASLLWLAASDVLGLSNENEMVQVTIPDNYSISSVSDTLYQKGLIKYKFLFKLYADFSHASEKMTPGTFELNKNYDYRALVNGMNIHSGKRVEIDVTIPEGFTLKQIVDLFVANQVCTEKELWDTVANYDFKYDFLDKSTLGDKHRLEGFLFPDTYTFYMGDSPVHAISKMLDNFKRKFKDTYIARAKEMGYSIRDIVTVAAMIEKEAGADSERDSIASVIYNRLNSKSFPHLQIDATIYYAIAETGEAFSKDVDSPYNTYMVKGLPAGPIANPGIASIKAALYPKTTNYYYYALNKSGTHNFYNDADSFNAFIHSDKYGG